MPEWKTLIIVMGGRVVGEITDGTNGKLTLTYDDGWRGSEDGFAISLSMPLGSRTFRDPVVRAFVWGLLPDNDQALDRWARAYHVSARNPFALLRHVGEDCGSPAPEESSQSTKARSQIGFEPCAETRPRGICRRPASSAWPARRRRQHYFSTPLRIDGAIRGERP